MQDKGYARSIEMVKLQYSGTEGGLVCGMDIVNLILTRGEAGAYCPLEFRIYAKEKASKGKRTLGQDGKTDQNGENLGCPGCDFCALGLRLVHCVSEICRFAMTASASQTPSSTVGFRDSKS